MVCRHMPPAPGCQCGPEPCRRRPESSCQVWPRVGGAKQRRVLHARVDGIGIGQRRLQMPDALELPGVRRAVVPLVRAGNAVVDEFVAHRLPGLAAIVRALDQSARTSRSTATRRFGSGRRAIPSRGRSPSPPKCGPLTSHFSRLPSAVRTNAPLRVPTRTLTVLIPQSPRISRYWQFTIHGMPNRSVSIPKRGRPESLLDRHPHRAAFR